MTLAIAVASADGITLAADSRTTVQLEAKSPTRVLSDFTHKVFQLGQNVVATYGWAFLERRNIAGHMAELEADPDVLNMDVEALTHQLSDFFGDAFDRHIAAGLDPAPAAGVDVLGFLVGGYRDGTGYVYEITLPTRAVVARLDSTNNPGAAWRGQTDVIVRLVKGVDRDLLATRALASGKQPQLDALDDELNSMEYVIPFNFMNLQDSVDFAVFAIRTTIDTQRLTHGTLGSVGSWPGVGGPVEIAVVTPKEGVSWVQRTDIQGERTAGEAEKG